MSYFFGNLVLESPWGLDAAPQGLSPHPRGLGNLFPLTFFPSFSFFSGPSPGFCRAAPAAAALPSLRRG